MISPVNSLANMELMLYGGLGTGANVPSYLNGYNMADTNSVFNYSPSFYGYNQTYPQYNQGTFGQQIPYGYGYAQNPQTQEQNQQQALPFQGLSKTEQQALVDCYAKGLEPSESLTGAAVGGAVFGALMNPRLLAHPYNFVKGIKDPKAMFAEVKKDGTWLKTQWLNKDTNYVLRDAYAEMHKAASRHQSKIGLFRRKYSDAQYRRVKNIMQEALDSKDLTKIREATEKLKYINKANGPLSRFWNWGKGIFGFEKQEMNILKRIGEVHGAGATKATEITAKAAEVAAEKGGMTLKKAFKNGGGVKGGIFFLAIEGLMAIPKIKTAFSKDKKTGMKQVGQTTVKAIGSAAGWAAGEAVGVWSAAALGAKIGTLFGPGVGTAIGALAGIVCGSIGCWAAGKVTKALVGDDVANKIEAEQKAQTAEGQVELIQFAYDKAANGEIKDAQTQQAVEKVLSIYA